MNPDSSRLDPIDYVFSLEKLGIKFGLHNIGALCGALGHPERAYRSVVVAGTNGKGSVAAMVERALRAAGVRTGRYTSPHLVRLEERFAVDGTPVATDTLREVAAAMPAVAARLRERDELHADPTFFEVTTAIAFELFRRASVEVAVLEVGMGGRLDATSVAPAMAAAITTIDLDHERYLGHTLAQIAFEKAGVIRPGMPVVVGETKEEPLGVIRAVCHDRGATLVHALRGVSFETRAADGRTELRLATPARSYSPVMLALRGQHQARNAIVAVRLLEELDRAGLAVGPSAIATGLTEVSWRGRLDLVETERGPVLFDGAHNLAGAKSLAAYLGEVYPAGVPMVFGAMADKDVTAMLEILMPHVTALFVTRPRTTRALSAEALAEAARAVAFTRPKVLRSDGPPFDFARGAVSDSRTATVGQGVHESEGHGSGCLEIQVVEPAVEALVRAQRAGSPVLVAGSLFLVGDLLADLGLGA